MLISGVDTDRYRPAGVLVDLRYVRNDCTFCPPCSTHDRRISPEPPLLAVRVRERLGKAASTGTDNIEIALHVR